MRTRKSWWALLLPLLVLVACTSQGGNAQESAQQSADTTTIEIAQPLPSFPYSELRQELIQEEAIQAFGLSSTSFFMLPGVDHPIQVCPSIGLPVPGDSSLSNPEQVKGNGNGNVAVGQMDPNGIYVGDTTGTYVLCLDSSGKPYMVHAEEYVHTVTAAATWNPNEFGTGKGGINVIGSPIVPDCSGVKNETVNGSKVAVSVCTVPPGTKTAPGALKEATQGS